MSQPRLISPVPCAGEGHVLLIGHQLVLHVDHLPAWLVGMAHQLDQEVGWRQVTGRPLLAAAVAGDPEAVDLLSGAVVARCRVLQPALAR